jgi:hypothetical protein
MFGTKKHRLSPDREMMTVPAQGRANTKNWWCEPKMDYWTSICLRCRKGQFPMLWAPSARESEW